jgi:hypothetical protein
VTGEEGRRHRREQHDHVPPWSRRGDGRRRGDGVTGCPSISAANSLMCPDRILVDLPRSDPVDGRRAVGLFKVLVENGAAVRPTSPWSTRSTPSRRSSGWSDRPLLHGGQGADVLEGAGLDVDADGDDRLLGEGDEAAPRLTTVTSMAVKTTSKAAANFGVAIADEEAESPTTARTGGPPRPGC